MTESNKTQNQIVTATVSETAKPAFVPARDNRAPNLGRNAQRGPGGNRAGGGRGGERKSFGGKKGQRQSEFEKRIVSIRRVSRTYSGGKRMRLSVCLVVGDKKGKVGIAIGKGADVISAEEKAYNKAKRTMVQIQLVEKTIAHQILYKKGAARIMLRPAAPGTGVIAGSSLRAVLECVGVEDILTKIIGTPNKINNAYACIEALQSLKKII